MSGQLILVLGLGGLLFLLLLGGIFIFLRRRAAPKKPPPRKAGPKQKGQRRKRPSAMRGDQPDATASGKAAPQPGPQPGQSTASSPSSERSERPEPSAPSPAAPPQPAAPPAALPAQPAAPSSSTAGPSPIGDRAVSGDKIRILVVDDNPDTRENVSRLLYFEEDLEVIGQAVNGRQGIEMALEHKPHIVLMDINMPDMDGIEATEKMSVDTPYSQVIIMSVQAEQHYMKRAMAAGARDFQPKPFTSNELISCIRRVYGMGRPIYQKLEAAEQSKAQMAAARPSKTKKVIAEGDAPVIAVYSPKGGVGTSAIAASLAVALQQHRGEAVLMDADLQFGDISVNLNTRPQRTMTDMVHNGELDIELLSDVVLAHDTGLKLLLAPPEPQLADMMMPDMVTDIIKELKNLFKTVVIDTNSRLDDVTLGVLEVADYVLVVTVPELPAIKSAKLFLELTGQLEFPPEKVGVLVNRSNEPGGVRPGQIAKVLKLEKQPYLVPDDSRLYLAMYKGMSVIQQDPNAPASQAIKQMAQTLWQQLAEPEPEDDEGVPANVVA